MLSRVFSASTIGLEGVAIDVEVDVAGKGFPTFTIVGLPNKAVDEAKDRVRTAINNLSYEMPDSRITVNLAPADIPKSGASFDLPMAVGILASSGMVSRESLKDSLFIGELSLEGRVRKVPGVISIALQAKKLRIKNVFLPGENAYEAALVEDLNVYPVFNLIDLIFHLNGQRLISVFPTVDLFKNITTRDYEFDFADINGQQEAKRALEIAAAGFHNVHLKGVPGAGKTVLCRAFPSIMPSLEKKEVLEVSKIYSVAGLLSNNSFITNRPFRSPHHTISKVGLIGGGSNITPGEISLSHRGVLFLDELSEFPRSVVESLRQPLEDGKILISRAIGNVVFPCRFLLLAASNPCPCGYLGHPKKPCHCLPGAIFRYKRRLSGPLLDRIDLHIDVLPVDEDKLISFEKGESSEKIRNRVELAKERQRRRFSGLKIHYNGEMNSSDVKNLCRLSDSAIEILKKAISRLSLSARSYFKTIKIAQTIADLCGKEIIDATYVAEALQYRVKDD
ncbi:YifB family Mg chelatase-like AAA ATPase [Candidatus Roizmanbacteria bacterium]|nr:YifB family Mg chelatase-like AAA ATPase [Candidatus Roizmanbacteria bacterium]